VTKTGVRALRFMHLHVTLHGFIQSNCLARTFEFALRYTRGEGYVNWIKTLVSKDARTGAGHT